MVDVAEHEYERANIPTYKPDHSEEEVIHKPMAFLVIKSVFVANILYSECSIEYTVDPGVPIAATDGKALYFNVQALMEKGWTIPEIAFVVAHEVFHVFLGDLAMAAKFRAAGHVDCGPAYGVLPYVDDLMNAACDYRINAMLIDGHIGKMPPEGLFDTNISARGFESAVEIYAKLFRRAGGSKDKKPPGNRPKVPGHGGWDIHLAPAPEHVETVESGRMDQIIAGAALAAEGHGQGSIPAAIQRLIGNILEPKVSWQDFLKSTIIRGVGDPQYDWRRIDRRLLVRPDPIYFAPQSHTGCGDIVTAVDTSGSINDKMIERFFSELNGIVDDLNPSNMWVMWCDAKVHRTDELEAPEDLLELHADIKKKGAGGGGGTDFRPVFNEIGKRDIQPDMLVYLTDGWGTFPEIEPHYPVVWAVLKGGNKRVPWGTVVEVEL